MKFLYDCGIYLLLPFFILYHSLSKARRQRLSERLALTCPSQSGGIWIHAASVGEVNAAIPMINALLQDSSRQLTITTQTLTGSARVTSVFGDRVSHQLIPFDCAPIIKRFVHALKPRGLIIMETELWPNLIKSCHQRRIPMIIANARLSPRAFKRYEAIKPLLRYCLQKLTAILAQSETDAERFIALGADKEHVMTLGNIKYAQVLSDTMRETAAHLRTQFGSRPVFIAASTHDQEEAIILEAFHKIRQSQPDCLLILVPRHIDRIPQILPLCHAYKTIRRSEYRDQALDILMVDTMGECQMLYGCADVAFVGGSLVPIGGHNPIEPALWGIPIMVGPYTENFTAIMSDFQRLDGIHVVESAAQIADFMLSYINNRVACQQGANQVQAFIQAQAQALDAHLAKIKMIA